MESMPDVSIVSHFKDLPDPRIERAKKHRLIDIIVIALGSVMVGGDGFQDMELFGKSKQAWLKQFLDLPNGIPSHDTLGGSLPASISRLSKVPFLWRIYVRPSRSYLGRNVKWSVQQRCSTPYRI